ncbi:hypothetical protein KM043_000852 [Ampulex compressa]|nr:hypothetical protein KM043_000852 [Ampulex compressa]
MFTGRKPGKGEKCETLGFPGGIPKDTSSRYAVPRQWGTSSPPLRPVTDRQNREVVNTYRVQLSADWWLHSPRTVMGTDTPRSSSLSPIRDFVTPLPWTP